MSFSNRFNSKAVKKATRIHTVNFNGIGNKIKKLGLSSEDETTIITILDKAYTDGHMKIQHAAAAGQLVDAEEATPEKQEPSLDDVLGTNSQPVEAVAVKTTAAKSAAAPKNGTGKKK